MSGSKVTDWLPKPKEREKHLPSPTAVTPKESVLNIAYHTHEYARKGEFDKLVRLCEATEYKLLYHRDCYGLLPLNQAAEKGHYAICEYLLKHGPDASDKSEESQIPGSAQRYFYQAPMVSAAIGGNPRIIQLFLAHGAKYNDKGFYTSPPLQRAALANHVEALLSLIKEEFRHEAKPCNHSGTCAMAFSRSSYQTTAQLLLTGKVSLEAKIRNKSWAERMEEKNTPLYHAILDRIAIFQNMVKAAYFSSFSSRNSPPGSPRINACDKYCYQLLLAPPEKHQLLIHKLQTAASLKQASPQERDKEKQLQL